MDTRRTSGQHCCCGQATASTANRVEVFPTQPFFFRRCGGDEKQQRRDTSLVAQDAEEVKGLTDILYEGMDKALAAGCLWSATNVGLGVRDGICLGFGYLAWE